jgi:predicted dehydrogenase
MSGHQQTRRKHGYIPRTLTRPEHWLTRTLFSSSWASRAHLPYWQSSPHYEITALQNSSKSSAEKAAKQFNLPNVSTYDDASALANDPNVDMVVVSIKVPHHAAMLEPAIRAGKDVFVEWPLARDLAEAEHLVALAKEKGVKRTLVGLQARQNPAIVKVKQMVEAGELGDILGSTLIAYGMILGETVPEAISYLLPIENGANLVTIPAGHALDAFCFALGEWEGVQATLGNNRPEATIVDEEGKVVRKEKKTSHDFMAISGKLKRKGNGVVNVVYEGGSNAAGKNFQWQINGTKGSLLLEADHGHVQMFQPTIKFVKAEEAGAEWQDVDVAQAKGFDFNVGKYWDKFAGVGDGTVVDFEEALVRHRMIDAIYQSDKNGTRESYL